MRACVRVAHTVMKAEASVECGHGTCDAAQGSRLGSMPGSALTDCRGISKHDLWAHGECRRGAGCGVSLAYSGT